MVITDRAGDDRGQSTVEFAFVLPLLLVVVLATVQVGLVVVTKLSVTHTAREIGRVLAVDPGADPQAIADIARPFGDGEVEVIIDWQQSPVPGRQLVIVQVIDVVEPVGGPWAPTVRVSATVAMLTEA